MCKTTTIPDGFTERSWKNTLAGIADLNYAGPHDNPYEGSILSSRPDGIGMFYGYLGNDSRQINVVFENGAWCGYVGGEVVYIVPTAGDGGDVPAEFERAEKACIQFIKDNPPEKADEA